MKKNELNTGNGTGAAAESDAADAAAKAEAAAAEAAAKAQEESDAAAKAAFEENARNQEAAAKAAALAEEAAKAKAGTVKVKVIVNAISENGEHYTRGQVFETTQQRADELGDSVTTNVNL